MEHICRASTTSKLSSELSISQTDESINGAELSLYLSNPCKPEEASPKTSKGFLAIQYISHSTAWKLRHHNHHVFLIVPPYSHYSCSTNNFEKRQSDTLIQRVDSCGVRAWKHNRAAPRFWSAPVGSIASKIFFFFQGYNSYSFEVNSKIQTRTNIYELIKRSKASCFVPGWKSFDILKV